MLLTRGDMMTVICQRRGRGWQWFAGGILLPVKVELGPKPCQSEIGHSSQPNPATYSKLSVWLQIGVWEQERRNSLSKYRRTWKGNEKIPVTYSAFDCGGIANHLNYDFIFSHWLCPNQTEVVRQARTLTVCLGSPACSKYWMLTLSTTLGKKLIISKLLQKFQLVRKANILPGCALACIV